MNADCVAGPPLSEPPIGQIVPEGLDLIADCTNRTSARARSRRTVRC